MISNKRAARLEARISDLETKLFHFRVEDYFMREALAVFEEYDDSQTTRRLVERLVGAYQTFRDSRDQFRVDL